jgi:hypothetical protein
MIFFAAVAVTVMAGRRGVVETRCIASLRESGAELSKKSLTSSLRLRGTKQEAIQDTVNHWIASCCALAKTGLDLPGVSNAGEDGAGKYMQPELNP